MNETRVKRKCHHRRKFVAGFVARPVEDRYHAIAIERQSYGGFHGQRVGFMPRPNKLHAYRR